MLVEVNGDSIISSVGQTSEPPTEDCADGECGFTLARRRRRRSSQSSTKTPTDTAPISTRKESKKSLRRRSCEVSSYNDIIVEDVPSFVTSKDITQVFLQFGDMLDVFFMTNDESTATAFVTFKTEGAVEAAVSQAEKGIFLKGHQIRVTRRHSWPSKLSLVKISHKPGSDWYNVLEEFDWKDVSARYVYRDTTMEDYFREFVHTLASFRGVSAENISDLKSKLIHLSDNRPEVIDEMMPPSISGMVRNQVLDEVFDVQSLLSGQKNQFQIQKAKVFYLAQMSKGDAALKLKKILLEGLYIYFFAKFAHGQSFYIKISYYLKSEPIRSALLTVTGHHEVDLALTSFFSHLSDVFIFKNSELKLKVDFFNKSLRKSLRRTPITRELPTPDDSLSPPQESPVEPFPIEMETETAQILGRVTGFFKPNFFIVEFVRKDGCAGVAFFDENVDVVGDRQVSIGSEVSISLVDIEEPNASPFRYRAIEVKVQAGSSPDRNPQDPEDFITKAVGVEIDRLLESCDDFSSTSPDSDFSETFLEMPEVVKSVVMNVFEEKRMRHQWLSNQDFVAYLLQHCYGGLSRVEREQIKLDVELECRKCLAKYLVRFCRN